MSTLKYSEWRADVLEKSGHTFKMVKDLAKVDIQKLESTLEAEKEYHQQYPSFKEKLLKQIKEEVLKAGKKGKEEPEEEPEHPIVQLSEIEQPPIEPTQTEEEEIAELVQLSKRGQIKLPNVTHVPGRTYPELKKVKQEKQQQQSKLASSKQQTGTAIASAGAAVVEGIEKSTCPAASIFKINTGDFLIGFGVGMLVTTLINVVKNMSSVVA